MSRNYSDFSYAPNNGGGYSRAPYNPNYRNAPRGSYQRQRKKHSGCRITVVRETGEQVLVGWNYSRSRGMIKMIAAPYKGTKTVESKRGKEWENWFVKITNAKTLQTTNHSGMWDCQRRRLVIKDLNMVANPGAPNGGYFGKHISKR